MPTAIASGGPGIQEIMNVKQLQLRAGGMELMHLSDKVSDK